MLLFGKLHLICVRLKKPWSHALDPGTSFWEERSPSIETLRPFISIPHFRVLHISSWTLTGLDPGRPKTTPFILDCMFEYLCIYTYIWPCPFYVHVCLSVFVSDNLLSGGLLILPASRTKRGLHSAHGFFTYIYIYIYIYHIYYICGMCDSLGFYLKTSERRNAPLGAMHWPPGRLQVGCKLQHDSFAPLQYDLAKFKFESRVPGSKFWAHHVNANPTWTQANPMWIVERRKSMQWTKSPKFLRRTPSIREWPSDGVGPKSGDYGQIPYSDGLTVGFCMRSR